MNKGNINGNSMLLRALSKNKGKERILFHMNSIFFAVRQWGNEVNVTRCISTCYWGCSVRRMRWKWGLWRFFSQFSILNSLSSEVINFQCFRHKSETCAKEGPSKVWLSGGGGVCEVVRKKPHPEGEGEEVFCSKTRSTNSRVKTLISKKRP